MRRTYACLLALDGDPATSLPTVRALVRQWASLPWGGWPADLPAEAGSFNPDGETLVRWRTLTGHAASVRELTIDEPFGDDASLRQLTVIQTGHDVGAGFVYVDVAVRSTDATLTGPVAEESAPPAIVPTVVERVACTDAGRRLTATAWRLGGADAPVFGRLVMDPHRRLPVLLLAVDGFCTVEDADDVADAAAGLAHVACVERSALADVAARAGLDIAPGFAAQLWWASTRAVLGDVPTQHFTNDALQLSRWGVPAWAILRGLYGASAFRLVTPPTATRLVAENARKRVGELEARARASVADAPLLHAYENDLILLEDAQRRVAELEAEVDRLQGDLTGLVAAFDNAVESALRARTETKPAPPAVRSLGDAVRLASKQCRHLVFLDKAFESADAWSYRRPGIVLDAFVALDRLVAQWQRDELPGGFTPAAKAAGLPYTALISRTAQTRYREDYVRTYEGEEVLMGPHLGWGTTTSNAVRAYLYLDRERRTVVVGHVGEHLRDTTKPHK